MTRWRIPSASPDLPPVAGFWKGVERIFASRWIGNYGPYSLRLERAAERWLGGPALAFSSGDAALAALMATCPAQAVIVSDWTFQSTASAVLRAGKHLIIAPVDEETLCLSSRNVSAFEPNSAMVAILATFAHGSTVCADDLAGSAQAHGVPLYFDAAHAFRPGCPIGDGAAFSLSGTKVVTCGEGGLLVLPQPKNARGGVYVAAEHVRQLREFRNYGFIGDYNATLIGLNGKLAELPAALALRSMARFKQMAWRRKMIEAVYRQELGAVVEFQAFAPADVPKDIVVRFPSPLSRAVVESALFRARIETKRYFRPLSMQHVYRAWWPSEDVRARSRALWERSLCLPLSSRMTVAQAREVAGIVAEACR